MISLVSPAKTLNFDPIKNNIKCSLPYFLESSKELVDILRQKSENELSILMKLSKNLSKVNFLRYKNWNLPFNQSNAKPAAFAFEGSVYKGLNISSFSQDELKYSQNNFRIISGLYGILRPLDLIMPYRLEMGTKLKNSKGGDLYSFWKSTLTNHLNYELNEHDHKIILNLASNEYSKAIDFKKINAKVITPIFKDWKNGKYKVISFFAKKARGMFVAYQIKNQIKDVSDLCYFSEDGYKYCKNESNSNEIVFLRK